MELIDDNSVDDHSYLRAPSNFGLFGATNSGKSLFLFRLLSEWPFIYCRPGKIVVFYSVFQPLFADVIECFEKNRRNNTVDVELLFFQGLREDLINDDKFWSNKPNVCDACICDDLNDVCIRSESFSRLMTVYGHHRNIITFFVSQNPFLTGRFSTTILRNLHYILLFKIPHANVRLV